MRCLIIAALAIMACAEENEKRQLIMAVGHGGYGYGLGLGGLGLGGPHGLRAIGTGPAVAAAPARAGPGAIVTGPAVISAPALAGAARSGPGVNIGPIISSPWGGLANYHGGYGAIAHGGALAPAAGHLGLGLGGFGGYAGLAGYGGAFAAGPVAAGAAIGPALY